MGKTIIQTIGPLYGEVTNGTVFGRPNGSVYVPAVNTITLQLGGEYVKSVPGYQGKPYAVVCDSNGVRPSGNSVFSVAESQDIASYIALEFSETSTFDEIISRNYSSGAFNISTTSIVPLPSEFEITAGVDYYVRAVLYSSTGVPVATSTVIKLGGWTE